MRGTNLRAATLAVVCALGCGNALAQWSSNTANNLKLADRSGDQVQPKISPTPDGGAYVSWYDNSAGGYDVYLQRVNAQGVEQWAHNGVQIADRSVSSTVDYGLNTDLDGNAVIVFNDDRTSPPQMTLQKVSPAGALMFNGSAGINVGPGSTLASPPKVAITTEGNYVVMWMNTSSPAGTVLQKVNSATGALLWGASGVVQSDWLSPARPVEASDVEPDNAGGVIALFVRCTGTNCVTSAKILYAQRYDATGNPVWTAGSPPVPTPVLVSTTAANGIQTGTFPTFLPDGAGGGVFGWYEIATPRNAYIQHILASGALKFPAPISNVGPGAPSTRIRVGAGLAYDRASGAHYLASPETDNSTQSQNSTFVQKFDPTGNRLWGDTGVTIVPTSSAAQQSFVQAQAIGPDVLVFFLDTRSAVTRVVSAARVNDNAGSPTLAWYFQPNSDSATDKSRLTSTVNTCGTAAMLAYGWGASGSTDIAVSDVLLDGTIGPGSCPSFEAQPAPHRIVCPGGTLTLSVGVSGNSLPCVQWQKGGVNLANSARISGATATTLTITGFTPADAGSYTAVATNTCGTLPSNASVVVYCIADFNCSGAVSVQDLFDFLGAWFGMSPRADINGVNGVTVQDLFDFLGYWFAGCG